MEPSTQEDSLIFASETRKRAPQWLWLDPPAKLDAVDDTLIDRSGSVDEDSFLFSKSGSSPQISRMYSEKSLQEHLRRGYDTLGDTQVIRRHILDSEPLFAEIGLQNALPYKDTQVILREDNNGPDMADTQVISNKNGAHTNDIADTQVIGPLKPSLRRQGSSFSGRLAHSIDNLGSGQNTQGEGSPTQTLAHLPAGQDLDDTQKIPDKRGSFAADTQADAPIENSSGVWPDGGPGTRKVPKLGSDLTRPTLLLASGLHQLQLLSQSAYDATQHDRNAEIALIDSSPTKVAETVPNEAPNVAHETSGADYKNAAREMSHIYSETVENGPIERSMNDENDNNDVTMKPHQNQPPSVNSQDTDGAGSVTFDVSFDDPPQLEPTTQVLNTQEEYIDEENAKPVDLSLKPIFLSSQNEDGKRRAFLGVESDVELDSMSHDETIVQKKRRRIALSSLSQSNGDKSKLSGSSLKVGEASVDGENRNNDKNENNNPFIEKRQADGEKSDLSSELEDISQDVNGIDLDALSKSEKQIEEKPPQTPTKLKFSGNLPDVVEPETWRENMPEISHRDIIKNPNGVWALHQFKKFPAKILKYGEIFSTVQFSANHQVEARNSDLHLLDICVGDTVQLKASHGDYLVVGLTFYTQESTIRCIRGYDTVILVKKTRLAAPSKEYMISLEDICMEMDQWALHQQRFHILDNGVDLLMDNYTLVREILCIDNLNKYHVSPAKIEHTLEKQHISPRKTAKELGRLDIFAGMLFFVTSIEGPRKDTLKEKIVANGGVFVDGEIKNKTVRKSSSQGLILAPKNLSAFKFAALLSDGPLRSAKYLQALTLGWPILADCFVDKVVENSAFLENWPVFLLPAGHSKHTRTMTNLDVYEFRAKLESEALLSDQLSNNSALLKGYTIVVLDLKQDSKMIDMCDFIFHAFGASGIKVVKNPRAVELQLRRNDASKCLVYDNSKNEFMDYRMSMSSALSQTKRRYGVVDWEWVVQCVISKYIWDPVEFVEV